MIRLRVFCLAVICLRTWTKSSTRAVSISEFFLYQSIPPFQTPYASTAECADLLLASVGGTRRVVECYTERGVPIAAEAHVGGFHLYSFAEATAGFHVDCLFMIPEMVRRHLK